MSACRNASLNALQFSHCACAYERWALAPNSLLGAEWERDWHRRSFLHPVHQINEKYSKLTCWDFSRTSTASERSSVRDPSGTTPRTRPTRVPKSLD
ncbi:hypothetical protein AMELA_G00145630 [Ameiurus melas]|uniref:Uncharacterized protein n=1 Tax=Ameiurus melas TaxID=219545 RepID=A0A7J6AG45_AMEME|nr:hypothetical protein AMELA_G00145630 [Ameiurus melas]